MARTAIFRAPWQCVPIAAVRIATVAGLLFVASLPSHAAIAWVGASHTVCDQPSSGTASQTCTLTAATTAGDDVVVGIAWSNTAARIVNVSGSSPTAWFIPYAAVCNGTNECVATLLCHQCTAQTAITTTMSEGTPFVTIAEEYSGVQAVGITGAQTASSASPGLTMTTGDANGWTVCATSSPGSAGIPSAGMGILRDASGTGTTSSDVAGAIVDNTSSLAGGVSCTDTIASDPWAATGIELRSVAPRTYIWPDCDTAHPCVVHHVDTVAAGTAENETPNGFKITTVPSSAGNLLTLTVTHVSTKTITISDNNGGNWQSAVTTNSGDAIETQLLYVCGAAAGTNVVTIQLSEPPAPGEVLQFSYNEVSGIAASACFDGATGVSAPTGDVQPGSISTTTDGDLIYNFGEEDYNYPEEDIPIGWVMPDDNSALLMESTWDKFASQVSVQATHGAYNPTLYVNGDLNNRSWNSVAAAFKPSAGAGTQPTGIHITRVMHYYNPPLPLTPAWIAFPSTGSAIVITSAYPSSGYEGDMTDVADNRGDTWTRTPFTIANDDPQVYYTCFGSAGSSRDLTIDWLPDTGTSHMILYDIAGAKTSGGSSGCVGATVNSQTGNQPSSANASILGAPVITPESSSSVVIAVNQLGIGPPSGTLTSGVVYASIWATGMTDATNWDSGDCYGYIYTTSTNPISFDWQMANANGLPNGGSNYDGAAIEILPFVPPQLTSIAVTPAAPTVAIGATQQFAAAGTYNDGSTQNITALATWSATPTTTSTINASGLATGVCPGSATIAASMSNVSGQTSLSVSGAATTTSIISVSPDPPPAGQAATLTVAVTSACGTPAGTVQFVIDGVNNGSPVTLNGSGLASTSVTLAAGSHTLSAVYAGSTNFSTSTSNTLNETVTTVATTTAVSVSPTGSLLAGSSYTLTATVTPASGAVVPTGNVVFTIGSTPQTVALNASGVATYSGTAPPVAGSLTISGVYQGSAEFSASTSNTLNVTIASLGTTTTLTISPSTGSLTAGSSYTLTATVAPVSGSGTPNGNIVFTIGAVTQAAPLNASGVATFSGTAPPAAGLLTISARYQGTIVYSGSTSNTLNETVVAIGTTTSLAITPTGSLTTGSSYTLSATVTPASGSTLLTGNVVFTIGSTTQTVAVNASGVATYSGTAPLAAGSLTISAAYQGSAEFSASASSTLNVTINALGTTTTLTISPGGGSLTAASSYTLTATVAPVSGSTIPTGNIVFTIGAAMQTVALNGSGVATWNGTAPTTPQSLTLSAAYQGSTEFVSSSSQTLTESVVPIATTTTLTIVPAGPLPAGSAYTLTATVAATGSSAIPTGNIVFTIGAATQTVALNGSGIATWSGTAPTTPQSLTISAAYQGSTEFVSSSSQTLSESVVPIATTTTLTIVPAGPLPAGSAYTLTATVAATGSSAIPTGNIVFTIGAATQTVALNGSGVATWSGTAPTTPQNLSVSAAYQGSAEFVSSSSQTLSESVVPIATTTTLTIVPAGPLPAGSAYTLTATVAATGSLAIPTGNIVFTIGATTQTVALNGSGIATWSGTAPTTPQNLSISAAYQGSTEYSGSTSNLLNETVAAIGTTISLATTPTGSLTVGSPYTLSATVTPASGSTLPTGNVLFTIGSTTQTVAVNLSGVATYSGTAPLAAGSLAISAAYQGSAEFSASTSSTLNVTITALGTTTTLAISPGGGSLTAGSSYTLTATVTPASGSTLPTGNVLFTIGSTTQTVAVNASGAATYSGTAPLAAGSLAISAAYQGSAEFSASTSSTLNVTITALGTTTTLTISPGGGSLTAGSSYTLTATVAPASGSTLPTGNVVFTVGSIMQTAAVNASGVATYSGTSPLAAGSLTISAAYQGSAEFSASTSSALNVTITALGTTTTLAISPGGGALTAGSSYTLTATVAPVSGSTIPTGNVVFTIGAATQTVALNGSGVATWSGTAPTTPEILSVSAAYQGSAEYSGSSSNLLNETVAAIGTTTSLAITPSGSLTAGSPYTLSATVTPASGSTLPTGNVLFTIGSTTQTVAVSASGVATYSAAAPMAAGSLTISAAYQGSAEFSASTSSTLNEMVVGISTSTALAASANQIAQGASITLAATVSAASGSTAPSGSVSFYNGPFLLGTSSLTQGAATLTSTALPSGTDSLTATYAGSVTFVASTSNPVTVVVNNALVNTITTLTTSASQAMTGTPVTLTAIVAAASGTTVPTGSVNFYNGTALLGSSTLSGGVASLTTSNLAAGSDAIVASYGGDSSSNPSVSNTVTIAVTPPPVNTTTTLSIAPGGGSLTVGSPFTLTAIVTPASGTTVPSGNVVFIIGSTSQTVALNASGAAAYSGVAPLASGSLAISAAYQGSAAFTPSTSNALNENVAAITTTTILSITPQGSLVAGTAYTVTAAVVPASGATIPTGNIVFTIGAATQTVALNGSGVATWSGTAPTTPQNLSISAVYEGSTEFAASSSQTLSESVVPIATTTTLTIVPAGPLPAGSAYTLSATVAATGSSAIPTGNIVFTIGVTTQTVALNSSGVATWTGAAPGAGTLTISAMYQGSPEFSSSTSNPLTEAIFAAPTNTTLTASATQVVQGTPVTLTATVTAGTGAPVTGSVDFYNGTALLGTVPLSAGVASLTTSTLPTGADVLNAMYEGNGGFAASTFTGLPIVVTAPSIPAPVIAGISPALVSAGNPAFTLTVTGSGFTSASTVSWGTTALVTQFENAGQLTAQVPAPAIASAGITNVTVQTPAPGGGTSNIFQFEIDSAGSGVTQPSFTSSTASITPGSTATYQVTLPAAATNVSAACLNLPAGATCSYSAASGSLTIATLSTVAPGTYSITVVFTETLPVAASAFALWPFVLLPLRRTRQRRSHRRLWLAICLASSLIASAVFMGGCGGGGGSSNSSPPPPPTQQVTSSGIVTLILQ